MNYTVLYTLLLRRNKLRFLSAELILYFNKLKVLKLENNPLECGLNSSLDGMNKHLKEAIMSVECKNSKNLNVGVIPVILCLSVILVFVIARISYSKLIKVMRKGRSKVTFC